MREYLDDPLSIDELGRIVELLGVRPIEIVRRGEAQYAALGLGDATPDEEVLQAMAEHPILIERPIVVRGGRAVVGAASGDGPGDSVAAFDVLKDRERKTPPATP